MDFQENGPSLPLGEKRILKASLLTLAGVGALVGCLACGVLATLFPRPIAACDPGRSHRMDDPTYGTLMHSDLDDDGIINSSASPGIMLNSPFGLVELSFNPALEPRDSAYSLNLHLNNGQAESIKGLPFGEEFQNEVEECLGS